MKLGSAGLAASSMSRSQPIVCVEPVALGLGALVAPDERGAEDLAVGVEHDAAVHLAGEADGFDVGRRDRCAAALRAPRMASWAARHQSSGSCSAQPMCSEWTGAWSAEC